MTHSRELAPEPRHSRGGAGGAARGQDEPSWLRQKVKVPKRVWGSGRYSPGAVAWHAQITALQCRPEHCRASVAVLAGWMGDSKRSGERYLAELHAPGPDGIPELTTIRHTDAAGDGETAERYTRALARDEHFAYVPVLAAKTLRHRLFVLYCAIAYAVATRTPVTMAELAALLGVCEYSARRMTNELERLGWITVHRRTGAHGRNEFEVHDRPLQAVPDKPPPPHTDGGSGACTDGGSLASKEDTGLTDGRSTQERGSSAVGEVTVSGRPPVDTGGNAAGDGVGRRSGRSRDPRGQVVPASLRGRVRPAAPPAYATGPLLVSPRVWAVLAPVRDLLPHVSSFALRRIAREIGRQLDSGFWAEDIRDQITRLRQWTPAEDIRDPGRWLLGAVLPVRSRCGRPGCHWGFLAYTGMPCKACRELEADRARGDHPPHSAWHECTQCQKPSRQPFPDGLCRTCA
ncbi:MarR family transcriptional regulator [Streptomyces sp. NPDC091972]|uniref:MarR family transcriptional regulator n=1 Tax=Streptomyces sp. NPDC091972 TaxID=3366007 RepID=UPI00380BAF6F